MPSPSFHATILHSALLRSTGRILSYPLLGLLLAWLAATSPALAAVYSAQNEPHLVHARALIDAALQAAGMEAQFVDAPTGNEHRNVFMVSSGQTDMDMMPATPERLRLVKEGHCA